MTRRVQLSKREYYSLVCLLGLNHQLSEKVKSNGTRSRWLCWLTYQKDTSCHSNEWPKTFSWKSCIMAIISDKVVMLSDLIFCLSGLEKVKKNAENNRPFSKMKLGGLVWTCKYPLNLGTDPRIIVTFSAYSGCLLFKSKQSAFHFWNSQSGRLLLCQTRIKRQMSVTPEPFWKCHMF